MSSFTNTEIGKENEKVFLHDLLGLTSCEISLNNVPQGFKIPFNHKHKQNEEVYIFIKGEGELTIDNTVLKVKDGSVVKISPDASRTLANTSDDTLQFICIQAKSNSLEQFGLDDAEIC